MSICRYCGQPISESERVKTFSYWSHVEFVCHRSCKTEGERQEATDCQTIDADCNDCRFYQRGNLAAKMVSQILTTDGRLVDVICQPNIFIGGTCLKFNTPTVAQPNKWTGKECFEHRRTA